MANLTESPIYEPGIFQLEKTTPPLGGAPAFSGSNPSAGHANVQGLQLANRTAYLKQMLDTGGGQLSLDLANNTDPAKGAAKIGWDGGTIADVLTYSKAVSNYTTLRAYTGAATTVRVLARNIEGLFYYDSTDTTTTDDGGVTIVGSDGRRWKRYYNGPVSIRWFGATGDGTTDDYPAIQLAFNWAPKQVLGKISGVSIKFPAGEYRMSQQAICDLAPAGTQNTGPVGISLQGEGIGTTAIVANQTNTTGCFRLTSGRNLETFEVKNMEFLSDLGEDAATNNGVALIIDSALKRGDDGYGDQPRWSVIVDSIYIGGWGKTAGNSARRGNWLKGINIKDKYHPKLSNIYALARYSNVVGARTACEYAIHFEGGCYSPEMDHMYIHGGWNKGIWLDDVFNIVGGFEDFRLTNSFIAGSQHCFGVTHEFDNRTDTDSLYEPGGYVGGLHVNGRQTGITIRHHRQVIIDGLYGYAAREDRAEGNLLPSIILLDGAADIQIRGEFFEPGFYNRDTNATVGVRIEGACEAIDIKAQFGMGGIGVLNNSTYTTRKTIRVEAPIMSSRRLTTYPTFKLLVDNVGTLTAYSDLLQNSQDRHTMSSGKPSATHPVAHRLSGLAPAQLYGGAYEIACINSAGNETLQALMQARFTDNTAGAEISNLGLLLNDSGTIREALSLRKPTVDNDSYGLLLFRTSSTTVVTKRVKMGAANSGPGGVGRALYVDN